jgi:hypothetical protein
MQIIRKILTPNELQSPNIRYNPATDEVEQTNDGGATWVPAPHFDPRITYQQPPVATANPRCDAAERMTALIREHIQIQIDALDNNLTQLFLLNTILAALAFATGIAIVAPVALSVVTTTLGLGAVALHEAFDAYDWDALKCQFYSVISPDGRMNQAQLDQIYAYLLQGTVTQNLVLGGVLAYMGYGVLSDAAYLRTETGDCSDCSIPWCYTFDFTASDGGWYPRVTPDGNWGATYVPGVGWGHNETKISWGVIFEFPITQDGTSCVRFVEAECTSNFQLIVTPCNHACCDGGCSYTAQYAVWNMVNGVVEGNTPCDTIRSGTQYLAMQISGGSSVVSSLTFRGIGTNPFGAANC